MRGENTVKTMSQHGFTQFELTTGIITKLNTFKLTPTAKLVLLYLTTCYNPKHNEIFPKQKTIANKLGISERSVTRAIQELFKEGFVLIECKYTNRYKFTSKIVSECPENLSDNKRQKVSQKQDNLSAHDIEQTIEPYKEPQSTLGGNVYSLEETQILQDYAKKHNAKNISAYVAKLRANGSDKTIIQEYKKQTFIKKRAEMNVRRTQEYLNFQRSLNETSSSYQNSSIWLELGRKIGRHK